MHAFTQLHWYFVFRSYESRNLYILPGWKILKRFRRELHILGRTHLLSNTRVILCWTFPGAIVSSTCTSCVAGTYSSLSGVKYLVARIKSLLSFSVAPYWQRATHRTGYAYSIRRYIASLIVGIQACSGPAVWLHVKDEILFCSVVTDHSRKLASADLILTAPTVAQVKPMSLRVSCAILEHIHRDLVRLISSVWLKKKSLIFLNRKWQCQHLYRLRCRNILERPWSLFDLLFISVETNVMQAMQVQ